jgi:membrane protease YdiL (CAAX protease family)
MQIPRRAWAFVALTALLSLPLYVLAARSPGDNVPVIALMWAPGLAAILVTLATTRSLRGLGWGLRRPITLLYALLVPLLYCAVVYGIAWASGLIGFVRPNFEFSMRLAPLAIAASLPMALGEELGWRGFLMPEVAKAGSFRNSVVFTAIVWALWHVPVMIWGGYNAGTPLWYGLLWFAVSVTGTTVILGWLRFASDSVWPCALYHAVHNTLVQSVFDASSNGPRAPWILGEFGFALAIAITAVAAVVWRRGVAAAARG